MSPDQVKVVGQKKMDALSAKHEHILALAPLKRHIVIVDYLALAVPFFLLTARLLTLKYTWGDWVLVAADILAAFLAAGVILKLVLGWQDRAVKHSRLRDENISLATQADALLRKGDKASSDSVEMFLIRVDDSEKVDREALGETKIEVKQEAYREALKERFPGSNTTVCPICDASPWNYIPGSCQTCGNTPKNAAKPSKI